MGQIREMGKGSAEATVRDTREQLGRHAMTNWNTIDKIANGTVLFCATGVLHSFGGIASSNQNVRLALDKLSKESSLTLKSLVLNENAEGDANYRTFNGSKHRFALAVLAEVPKARLLVFDHVQPALPILPVPKAILPPIAIFAHGSESWRAVRRASKLLFRKADLVLTNSNYTLRKMRETFTGFNGKSCLLGLPPTFSVEPTETDAPPPKKPLMLGSVNGQMRPIGSRMLLLVGRLDPRERQKGHSELLAILPSLLARYPDVQLVFAGGGAYQAVLEAEAKDRKVDEKVFITGHIDHATLQQLYKHAFAYAMPSRQEGFGLVYLEAMQCSLPCIACKNDGGADVVEDGVTGLLVNNPIELGNLRRAIFSLLENPEWAASLGRAGYERLDGHFRSEHYLERVRVGLRGLLQ